MLAVVVAALILGQKSTRAGYATRLQDTAVWKALQLILESFAFLMIGLQLPTVVGELEGITASVIAISSVGGVGDGDRASGSSGCSCSRICRGCCSSAIREREPAPTPAQVFVVAWAGMRGVVSLAAAFGVPMTTLSGAPFPGRPQLVFLTFVVVIGTLLLHGLTLPWLIRRLGVQGDEARTDAIAAAAAQDKAARAAAERLDELLAEEEVTDVHERAADVLRGWNTRRRNSAWERLGRDDGGDRREPRMRRSVGCGWKCWRPNARRSSPNATTGRSTTRCCGRCCAGSTSRRRRSTGRSVEFAAECPHRIDQRGEGAMGGGEILVGQVGQAHAGYARPAA